MRSRDSGKGGIRPTFVEGATYLVTCVLSGHRQGVCMKEDQLEGSRGRARTGEFAPFPRGSSSHDRRHCLLWPPGSLFSLVTSRVCKWHRNQGGVPCFSDQDFSMEDRHRGKGKGAGGGEESPWKGTSSI